MSIIYKALQKTQKNREIKTNTATLAQPNNRFTWFDIGLIAIIILLLAILSFTYIPKITFHHTKQVVVVKPQAPVDTFSENDYRTKHMVNGVFVSDQNKFVMINSQPFHIGDNVDGMMIVSIDYSDIKLQNANHALTLKVPA